MVATPSGRPNTSSWRAICAHDGKLPQRQADEIAGGRSDTLVKKHLLEPDQTIATIWETIWLGFGVGSIFIFTPATSRSVSLFGASRP